MTLALAMMVGFKMCNSPRRFLGYPAARLAALQQHVFPCLSAKRIIDRDVGYPRLCCAALDVIHVVEASIFQLDWPRIFRAASLLDLFSPDYYVHTSQLSLRCLRPLYDWHAILVFPAAWQILPPNVELHGYKQLPHLTHTKTSVLSYQ
jgi:hypothetical protein